MKNVESMSKVERENAENANYLQGYAHGLSAAMELRVVSITAMREMSANAFEQISSNPPPPTAGLLFLPYSFSAGYKKAIDDCTATPRSKWVTSYDYTQACLQRLLSSMGLSCA